ncbi:hypothetical protein [Patulibacter sp.]|uniref:hypothetical protein n=1 Tax=Patulibacter sp. TaxID=1912859 RepID=UPI0027259B4D|nr:hypothetical protein [Patulibacter sp.]MDO9407873.1 hypothetical protein [Patulibacter sp.]
MTVREEIVEAALRRIGDADLSGLFRSVTPDALAADAPWSASSVRYHFGTAPDDDAAGRLAFNRRDLGLAVLEAALQDAIGASADAADVYRAAAESLPSRGSMDEVLDAVKANLAAFVPGASPEDVSPRERMYFLALAVCDEDRDVSRRLREARSRQIERYAPMYRAYLDALDRELHPERTVADLANAIYALLDGHIARLRFDPSVPSEWVGEAVLTLFASFTVRRGAMPRTASDELLGG